MKKLHIIVDDNSVQVIGAASAIDMIAASMQVVNAIYSGIAESGHSEAAKLFRDVYHDKDMVDAIFAPDKEQKQKDAFEDAQKKRLEKVFRMLLEDDD